MLDIKYRYFFSWRESW